MDLARITALNKGFQPSQAVSLIAGALPAHVWRPFPPHKETSCTSYTLKFNYNFNSCFSSPQGPNPQLPLLSLHTELQSLAEK